MSEKEKVRELIRLERVYKIYRAGQENEVRALQNINLKIIGGEFVAIMGPSGSGKSTCMNLIGSLDIPTKGKVFLENKDISKLAESELALLRGKKIGFIFQQFNLIPNLTALENVALPMIFQGVKEYERIERGKELLKKFGLADRMYHYPAQLSGGEQQRVAIARALANNPDIILADEPTGNLDSINGEIILSFLDALHKEGKTIVMITHDQNLALRHAEIIYWLKDGKIEKVTKKYRNKWITLKRR